MEYYLVKLDERQLERFDGHGSGSNQGRAALTEPDL
jgi:hypothetical protein